MKIQRNYLIETKQDIEKFVNKFGQETYDLFNKSRDRLKNNGYSTDIIYYTNKVSKEELDDILSKLQRRLKTKDTEDEKVSKEGIRGKYKYLGEKDGYKVYQPLDYLASVDLGYMSGWCTTGRYGHAGERDCKPSEENAKEHFDAYRNKGITLYYFLDSKTMEGKYAIAKYPRILEVNKFIDKDTYIISTNFELYNQEDKIDYSAIDKIPIELIKGLEIKREDAEDGLFIKDNILIKANENLTSIEIPSSVTNIAGGAFKNCRDLKSITIPSSVTSIGDYVFSGCSGLTRIEIPSSVTSIGERVFSGCIRLKNIEVENENENYKSIDGNLYTKDGKTLIQYAIGKIARTFEIPSSVTSIGNGAFLYCSLLTSISLPSSVENIGDYAFYYCGLRKIYYNGTKEEFDKTKIGNWNNELFTATIYYNSKLSESYIKEDKAKENLNQKLWQNNELKPTIRQKIEEIVSKFIKGLEELKIAIKIEDIRIVGSNASYNYTEDSDLDIHIVVDLNEYSEEQRNLIKLIFDYYKSSFNDKYEIYIKGIPVELYIEDQSNTSVSNGVYSVYKDEWLKFPEIIEKKDIDIKKQFDYVLNQYKKIRREQDKTEAQKLLDTLYFNRKMSLALEGEYGVDNLVFKKFRACGYLEELKKFIKSEESKELSLENLTNEWKKSIV